MPDLPWWGWLVLVAAAAFALAGIGLRILRASSRGRRFLRLSLRGKLRFARVLMSMPGTPLFAKALIVLLAGYLALPFDLVPDFLPVVGQLDDVVVLTVGILALILLVPRERFEYALLRAEHEELRVCGLALAARDQET